MISTVNKALLFLSSYLPVFVIFTLLAWTSYGPWALLSLLAGVLGIIGVLAAFWWARSTEPEGVTVASVERKDTEALAYLVTYVLPFLDVDLSDSVKILGFVILFVTLATVYINADMLHINPTLNLLGWHVFEVQTPAGSPRTVLTHRRRLLKGDTLKTVRIADNISVEAG